MKISDTPIITKFTYNTSVPKLWNAISNHDNMKQWYFEILEDFVAEVGFKTSFQVSVEDRTYTHNWEVTDVIPLEMIQYTWTFDEYDGSSYTRFEISEKDSLVELTLTEVVTKDYPSGIPEFEPESSKAGWQYFLNQRLRSYLED